MSRINNYKCLVKVDISDEVYDEITLLYNIT